MTVKLLKLRGLLRYRLQFETREGNGGVAGTGKGKSYLLPRESKSSINQILPSGSKDTARTCLCHVSDVAETG